MNDVLRALAISAGILSVVTVLIVFISIVVVKRGEHGDEAKHDHADDSPPVKETASAGAPPVKAAKPAGPAAEEISVMQILLLGGALFTLAILVLFALSLVQHSM